VGGTSGEILDSLRESRICRWRPCSLAALVDATSRVSDNYCVKRFAENTPMTMPEHFNGTEREKADGEAVLRHAFHGEPLDAEVARRVHRRGAEITEEIYRAHGEIDPETINETAFGVIQAFFQNHAAIVTLYG
jgi:hypothetical protein